MDFSKRKRNRLKDYDYSANGAYFVTVCTTDRQKILSHIVGDDAHIVPTNYGAVVEKYIKRIPGIEKYVIMPNHIHMMIFNNNGAMWASPPTENITKFDIDKTEITVTESNHIYTTILNDNGAMWASPPTQSVSQKIKTFKCLITKEIGKSIFQRSFHDHIIRNRADYLRIWQYIDENPLKWELDRYYIE